MRRLKLPDRDPSKPRLNHQDVKLVEEIGVEGLKQQAEEIVRQRLGERPVPSRGNPIYKAMHACGAATRQELSRTHKIQASGEISERHVKSVVDLLTRWVVREYNFYQKEDNQKKLQDF